MKALVGWACVLVLLGTTAPLRADVPAPPPKCKAVGDSCSVTAGSGVISMGLDGNCVAATSGKLYCKVGEHCYESGVRQDAEKVKPPCDKLQLAKVPVPTAKPGSQAETEGCGGSCATRRGQTTGGAWVLLPLLLLARRLRYGLQLTRRVHYPVR